MKISKQHISSNKRPYRLMKPTFITIHSTGNDKSTAQNERDWLMNPSNNRAASWHYVVSDSMIIEAIPANEVAWHSGTTQGNNTSIGIEMVHTGDRNKVIENTIWLVKQLQKQFNIDDDKVLRHYDWTKKNCPSILNYNNWQGWIEFKSLLRSEENMTTEEVRRIVREELDRSKLEVSPWAKEEWEKGIGLGITDGSRPRDYATREEVMGLILRSRN